MLSLPRVRKRPASESPLEDSLAPADLPPGSVSKEVGVSKVSKKNPGGRGHHVLPSSVAQAAGLALSRGRPSQKGYGWLFFFLHGPVSADPELQWDQGSA